MLVAGMPAVRPRPRPQHFSGIPRRVQGFSRPLYGRIPPAPPPYPHLIPTVDNIVIYGGDTVGIRWRGGHGLENYRSGGRARDAVVGSSLPQLMGGASTRYLTGWECCVNRRARTVGCGLLGCWQRGGLWFGTTARNRDAPPYPGPPESTPPPHTHPTLPRRLPRLALRPSRAAPHLVQPAFDRPTSRSCLDRPQTVGLRCMSDVYSRLRLHKILSTRDMAGFYLKS
jgi:hypothetical protein